MATNQHSRRISREQWLRQALQVLEAEGIDAVRIERLAREVGVAKSGFYWHFEGRGNLLQEMLTFWSDEFTESVAGEITATDEPAASLLGLMEAIEERQLARYDLALRAWAASDPAAMKVVRKVYRRRVEVVRDLFEQLGFEGPKLEMRVQLLVCMESWQQTMFKRANRAERETQRRQRWKLLISRPK